MPRRITIAVLYSFVCVSTILALASPGFAAEKNTGKKSPAAKIALTEAETDVRLLPPARQEAPVALIPFPQKVEWLAGAVPLRGGKLEFPENAKACDLSVMTEVRRQLEALVGPVHPEVGTAIRLVVGAVDDVPAGNREAYAISAEKGNVELRAPTAAGFFNAVQTLRQLVETFKAGKPGSIPSCRIRDWPVFEIRGFMLDTGRNYQSPEMVKRQIALASAYKLNVFHWHLTEGPGYRIESKAFPALNAPESYTRMPGMFYSYAQIHEIQAFAAARNVEIIPEIDCPGHSDYFKRALGYDMQSPQGEAALLRIFKEVCDEIPTRFIHIGSDEVRIRNPNLIPNIVKLLREQNRRVIVWRPGVAPLPECITQGWLTRWSDCEPLPDRAYIDSTPFYFNTTQPTEMHRWFFAQPCGVPTGNAMRLGAIGCAWPDTKVDDETMTLKIMPMVPGLLTLSERAWRGAEKMRRDIGAVPPLPGSWEHKAYDLFERDLLTHGKALAMEWPFPYVKHLDLSWQLLGPIPNNGVSGGLQTELDAAPGRIPEKIVVDGTTYSWHGPYYGGTINLQFWRGYDGLFQSVPGGVTYARATWQCDADCEVGLWVQFDPKFGNTRGLANPARGEWSERGANLWINGKAVPGPDWKHPGKVANSGEVPLVDEAFFYRAPTRVQLKKGINTVLLKVPFHGTKKVVVSTFTCIPVEVDAQGRVQRSSLVR